MHETLRKESVLPTWSGCLWPPLCGVCVPPNRFTDYTLLGSKRLLKGHSEEVPDSYVTSQEDQKQAEEMVQWLREIAALAENLGSIISTHMEADIHL